MEALRRIREAPSHLWDEYVSNLDRSGLHPVEGTFRVTHYEGLERGRSGVHEIAEGTFAYATGGRTRAVSNVRIAMNVASIRDPHGLPREVPLKPGEVLRVRGELIPARETHLRDHDGPEPVLHFTHAPQGYVEIDGVTYR